MTYGSALWIEWIVKAIIMIVVLLTGFAYTTYMERKLLGRFQSRYGPNRAGPMGLLQPVADGIKLIFKEELIPAQADKLIFVLAPIITTVPAWIILAVVPLGAGRALRPHDRSVDGGKPECRGAVHHCDHFHLGLWHRAGGVGVEQQIRHVGRHPLFGADDQL